jgi:hypothetical protein
MASELDNNDIFVLLILVFLILLKVVFSGIVHFSKFFNKLGLNDYIFNLIDSSKTGYSSLINIVSVLVGIYFIFIKKTDNIYFIVGFSILMFKAFMHFLTTYKLYKIFNLSPENEQKLRKFKKGESLVTNYVLFFLTLYIIKKVFL